MIKCVPFSCRLTVLGCTSRHLRSLYTNRVEMTTCAKCKQGHDLVMAILKQKLKASSKSEALSLIVGEGGLDPMSFVQVNAVSDGAPVEEE